MYREKDLQDCLFGLVGFRQTDNPDYPTLTESLLRSDSGLYVQDEHPLLTIENIDQSSKNYDKFNYPDWLPGSIYVKGEKVKGSDGKIYESLQSNNQGNDPVTPSPAYWVEFNKLSQKIEYIMRSAINKVFSRVFIDKKLNEVTKSIFENIQIFEGAGSLQNKEIKLGRFVGFQIDVYENRDLTVILRRLGTQFSEANPDFNLYVFHSSQETPIKVFDLALAKQNSFEWSKLIDNDKDFVLRWLSEDYSPGGSFYIGYYEDDLVGQAINKGYSFAVPPNCSSCGSNYYYWSMWSQYVRIQPIEIRSSDLADIKPGDPGGAKLWDIRRNGYPSTKNFGLNFDLTVACDVTDFFCRERRLFTDAILKQATVDILNNIAYATRNNPISKETRDLAMYELNNKDNKTPGAAEKLEKVLKSLSFDVSDLNEACLPCNDKYGANWSSV